MPETPKTFLSRLRGEKILAPDTVRLLWLWTVIGLAGFARPFFMYFMPAADGHYRDGTVIGADFVDFWVAAKLALAGKVSHLYDDTIFWGDVRGFFGADYQYYNFLYPPNILPFIALFGLLPYFAALFAWIAAGTACLIAALRVNPFFKAGAPLVLLVAFSPAALFNLWDGHNGAFTAALFLGGFYLSERRPVLAGVLFGLLTFKPHLGTLVPVALLLRRNWKCIGAATLAAALLAGLGVVFWGFGPWVDWYTHLRQEAYLTTPTGDAFNLLLPGPYADAAMVLKLEHPWLVYAPAALLALACSVMAVRRDGISARSVLILALSTLIIAPYGLNYDMVAVSGALAVYLATRDNVAAPLHLVLGLLWALPLAIIEIKHVPLPLSSAILLLALGGLSLPSSGSKPMSYT